MVPDPDKKTYCDDKGIKEEDIIVSEEDAKSG